MKDAGHPVESLGSVFAALLFRAPIGRIETAVREKIHVVHRTAKAESLEVGDLPGHMQDVAACGRRQEKPIRLRLAA
jgi:hypothetical protein